MFAKRLVVLCCLILVGSAQGGLITDAVPVGKAAELGANEDAVGSLWVHDSRGWVKATAFLSVRDDRITSASHPFDGLDGYGAGIDDVRVYFGSDLYNAPYQGIRVTSWKRSPGYAPGTVGTNPDLAVAVLEKPAIGITPLQFWSGPDVIGEEITIVDFGMWGNNALGQQPSDGKRRAGTNRIDIMNFGLYSPDYMIAETDRPSYSGATEYEYAAAPGASGGPTIIERDGVRYVNGVVSFGSPGNILPGHLYEQWTGIYRVAQQYDWLMANVPEPSTVACLILGASVLFRRRA